jgi:hypothetical protein
MSARKISKLRGTAPAEPIILLCRGPRHNSERTARLNRPRTSPGNVFRQRAPGFPASRHRTRPTTYAFNPDPHQGLRHRTLVPIGSTSIGGFDLPTKVLGSGRVPHVRPSVHGPKTDSSNAFTACARSDDLGRSHFAQLSKSVGRGCAPSFSAHVGLGEHGAPLKRTGLRSLLQPPRRL